MKNSAHGELDVYFPIREEYQSEVPKTRFKPKVGKTLSARRWNAAFSKEGHLDIAAVLRRIQRGGIHPSIKGEVWEFLLGCFDPNSSVDERNEIRQKRREQYAAMKAACQQMVPVIGSGKFITAAIITDDGQPITDGVSQDYGDLLKNDVETDKRVIQWKLSLHQIGLDVVRTDQTLVFYENLANQAKLWDVLSVYSWVDNDIGYVQGMNDICSPMIILLENEADAFWCFEHAMRKVESVHAIFDTIFIMGHSETASLCFNTEARLRTSDPPYPTVSGSLCGTGVMLLLMAVLFMIYSDVNVISDPIFKLRSNSTSIGVQSQLSTLSQVMRVVDPKLHQHLEELDGGEYLFAFRMLMVLFRREFSFVDALYLWEVMWAMEYNPNLFTAYEESSDSSASSSRTDAVKTNSKVLKQYGKFERKNVETGVTDEKSVLAVFLVASVLETKNKRFLKEAKGLDDVVQILGDITGNLDAKKALHEALKIHKKYLKAKKS